MAQGRANAGIAAALVVAGCRRKARVLDLRQGSTWRPPMATTAASSQSSSTSETTPEAAMSDHRMLRLLGVAVACLAVGGSAMSVAGYTLPNRHPVALPSAMGVLDVSAGFGDVRVGAEGCRWPVGRRTVALGFSAAHRTHHRGRGSGVTVGRVPVLAVPGLLHGRMLPCPRRRLSASGRRRGTSPWAALAGTSRWRRPAAMSSVPTSPPSASPSRPPRAMWTSASTAPRLVVVSSTSGSIRLVVPNDGTAYAVQVTTASRDVEARLVHAPGAARRIVIETTSRDIDVIRK